MDVEVHEDRIVVTDAAAIFEFGDYQIRGGKFESDLTVTSLDVLEQIGKTPPYRMHLSAKSQSSMDGFRRALDNYFTLSPKGTFEWARLLPIACRAAEEAYKETIQSVDPDDFEIPRDRSELIEGVLPEGQLTCLFGLAETAKSLSALAMCMSMAGHVPFVGKRTQFAGSLWLDAENPQINEFAIRRNQLIMGGDYDTIPGCVRWMSTKGMSMPDLVPTVRRELDRSRAEVIVVDSAGFVSGGNPIDPEIAIKTCNALLGLKRTVLLVAQTTKDDNDKMPFGSTFWHYAVHGKSWYLSGAKYDNTVTTGFYLRKSSDGARPPDFAVTYTFDGDMGPITVTPGNLRQLNEETGKLTDWQKMEYVMVSGALTPLEISTQSDVPLTTVRPLLSRYKAKGRVVMVGAGTYGLAQQ